MNIEFIKLNENWNAEPNAPDEHITVVGNDVILEFTVNSQAYSHFAEDERLQLIFQSCSKFRLGTTNDEGWHMGKCRFVKLAPYWGDFYKVTGDLTKIPQPSDWQLVNKHDSTSHYLFYLRDNTFECVAENYELVRITHS